MFNINSVDKITFDHDGIVLIVECNITNASTSETFDAKHGYRDDDPHGLSPVIKQWLIDNSDFPIDPYVAPVPLTAEELREQMKSITPRQLRLALVRSGTAIATVEATLDALPDGDTKEEAKIEWEYATVFERLAPALLTIANALGFTPSEVDTLWGQALTI